METKLPSIIGPVVKKIVKFYGFGALRLSVKGDICKNGRILTYESSTVNSDEMLNLETGVVTIKRSGMYSISFHGIPSYGVKTIGIDVVQDWTDKTGKRAKSFVLSTYTLIGNSPLSAMRFVDLKDGDQIRVEFYIGDRNSKICSYSGDNIYLAANFFSGILVDPFD